MSTLSGIPRHLLERAAALPENAGSEALVKAVEAAGGTVLRDPAEFTKRATMTALLAAPVTIERVGGECEGESTVTPQEVPGKKPRLNQTERRYRDTFLRPMLASGEALGVLEQAVKFRLADATYYTPDLIAVLPGGQWWIIEVKGARTWDDALVKFKVAAELYPWWRWTMVQWKDGEWRTLRDVPAQGVTVTPIEGAERG